ncbi:MAG: hypothetical protein J5622_02515, partial [Firmicutes bacterium]|nr:hypothetical protein [Bacillota bacterium]
GNFRLFLPPEFPYFNTHSSHPMYIVPGVSLFFQHLIRPNGHLPLKGKALKRAVTVYIFGRDNMSRRFATIGELCETESDTAAGES